MRQKETLMISEHGKACFFLGALVKNITMTTLKKEAYRPDAEVQKRIVERRGSMLSQAGNNQNYKTNREVTQVMKTIVIATFFVLGMVAAASAGDYHYGTTLICADCHVMHFSQQHGYNNDGGGTYTPLGSGPNHGLLRDEVNKLCLNCHDGQAFAPDVYGNNTGTHVRQAGALNKATDAGPYYPQDGHTLFATSPPPGGTGWTPDATEGLTCINCHAQHGNVGSGFALYDSTGDGTLGTGMYRNLRTSPGNAGTTANPNRYISYRVGTNSTLRDVFERATGPGVATHYAVDNVDFNEPNATKSAYGAWCQGCHTDFHGTSTDANMRDAAYPDAGHGWFRHPTADINIGQQPTHGHSSLATFRGNLYRTQVMSPGGDWGTQGVAWAAATTDLTPSCFSCHKGHGNKNAFGLIYALGNGALGEEGDGTQAKNLCRECHVQGAD